MADERSSRFLRKRAGFAAFVGAGRRSLAQPGDRRLAEAKAALAFVGEARESGDFRHTHTKPGRTQMFSIGCARYRVFAQEPIQGSDTSTANYTWDNDQQ